jgi:hypothetical protein
MQKKKEKKRKEKKEAERTLSTPERSRIPCGRKKWTREFFASEWNRTRLLARKK